MATDHDAAVAAFTKFGEILKEHEPCKWEKVGSCVYCIDHHVRLYNGDLPDERRSTPKCAHGEHEWDDANSMSQCGFYFLCLRCGEQEWT